MYKDKKVSVIIAAAGSSARMGGINKQYLEVGGMPVLARSAKAFEKNAYTDEIIIAVRAGDEDNCMQSVVNRYSMRKVRAVVAGGSERCDSVKKALDAVSEDCGIVLVHDGARPFVTQRLIHDVIDVADRCDAAVPCVSVKDTIKIVENGTVTETPDRSNLRAVQTPQGFSAGLLREAYEKAFSGQDLKVTDDASVVEAFGHEVTVVESDEGNIKITTPEDLKAAEALAREIVGSSDQREFEQERQIKPAVHPAGLFPSVGIGYDVHAFKEGRKLWLGGVEIPYEKGLDGHSDADVLIHAVIDALLGAACLGNIGIHFPDHDPQFKDISSLVLLAKTRLLLAEKGWRIVNIDAVVIAQEPRIASYVLRMREKMSEALRIPASQINIKGTTTEGLGFAGRKEGIAAQAVVSIVQ